ncbi:MAG: ATP-binding protein [Thiohalospira sp.]
MLSKKIASLENAQDIIFEQFRELELQRKELELQQKKLEETSEKFRSRTIELFGKMIDLKKAKKTISQQNEKLEQQQVEIDIQQKQLEHSSQKFRERTIELFGKMIDLKKAKKTISKQKEEIEVQRKKLDELNASKDKFFSIIAHDLRNPIAGFLNLTEVLTQNFDTYSGAESKEFIDIMNQASKQLYNLLENLLQWSRAQTGRMDYNPKIISLKEITDNTIDLLMMNIEDKKIKIIVKIDGQLKVYADENMVTTVVRNLISNAIKFSHPEDSITIRAKISNKIAEVSVIDQGVGIKKEDQKKLFKIDSHITTPGTSNESGTGLGLILCKEFIEKNGGEIWVESEINKGSAFKFTLPVNHL